MGLFRTSLSAQGIADTLWAVAVMKVEREGGGMRGEGQGGRIREGIKGEGSVSLERLLAPTSSLLRVLCLQGTTVTGKFNSQVVDLGFKVQLSDCGFRV